MRRLGLAGRSTRPWVWPQVCTGYFPGHVPPHWLFCLIIYSPEDITTRPSAFCFSLTHSLSSVYLHYRLVQVQSIQSYSLYSFTIYILLHYHLHSLHLQTQINPKSILIPCE